MTSEKPVLIDGLAGRLGGDEASTSLPAVPRQATTYRTAAGGYRAFVVWERRYARFLIVLDTCAITAMALMSRLCCERAVQQDHHRSCLSIRAMQLGLLVGGMAVLVLAFRVGEGQ